MNILIPHPWLLEHLDTDADPTTLQTNLSLSGPSVERVYEREGDSVYDIEVTTNRVDSMSVRGIAREAAVILEQFGIRAQLKQPNYEEVFLVPDVPEEEMLPLPAIHNDLELCERIMAVVLKDVERTSTPEWMAKRLRQIDINVHDSVIDITNYITHEVGHPVHAFDYDKLMALGGEIIIKAAAKGKKFVTLDGLEFETVGGEVVFENREGTIIDLPSIKGTANTAVDEQTRNVLLLIDSIEASKIRFASMTHQIRTVAAQLKEKQVDPHLALPTFKLGIKLYRELCSAKVASPLYDDFPGERQPAKVILPLQKVEEYLGLQLETEKIVHILDILGCEVKVEGEQLSIQPPTFRPDLKIAADIIEEIARIYGYHNLPSQIMATAIPLNKPANSNYALEMKIKRFLATIGWQEMYTYSLISEAMALATGQPLANHLKLENPLTEDQLYLRRSLQPSLVQVLNDNSTQGNLSVFEMANVYIPVENDLPRHELRLGLVSNKPYRAVKGDLEALLRNLFIEELIVKPLESESTQKAELFAAEAGKEIPIGTISVLPKARTAINLDMAALLEAASTYPQLQPLPKAAPVIEDMTFTLPEKTFSGQVINTIKQLADAIYQVELKDIYQQNYTFTITYLGPNASISAEDIKPIRQKIADTLMTEYRASLVGAV